MGGSKGHILRCLILLAASHRAAGFGEALDGHGDPPKVPAVAKPSPEDLPPLIPDSVATRWLRANRVRAFGWLDAGFTFSSSGRGLHTVAPSPNRFGNEPMLNGAWLITERVALKEGWSWGFRADFYAGADAALLRPLPSFGPQGSRFGTDFRQAYLSLHTPGVNGTGIDWVLGRQNVPLGVETLMGPYRPLYSETYFWIHYQVGSTSALATIHPTRKLDVTGGAVLGYNTVFRLRGRAPSYLLKALYRPRFHSGTELIATALTGPKPFASASGHSGSWQTVLELQGRLVWNSRVTQSVQAHYAVGTGDPISTRSPSTRGAFLITSVRLNPRLLLSTRGEWFSDPHGVRSGAAGRFSEITLGLNYLPTPFVSIRPEVRGDFAGQRSYSSMSGTPRRNQLTVALDVIFQFDAIK